MSYHTTADCSCNSTKRQRHTRRALSLAGPLPAGKPSPGSATKAVSRSRLGPAAQQLAAGCLLPRRDPPHSTPSASAPHPPRT